MKTSSNRSSFCLALELDTQSKKKKKKKNARKNPVNRDHYKTGNDESCLYLPNHIRKGHCQKIVDVLLIEIQTKLKSIVLSERDREKRQVAGER